MKISIMIDAPKWSAKDADAFAEAVQRMLHEHAMFTLDNKPAFVASYKVKKAKGA